MRTYIFLFAVFAFTSFTMPHAMAAPIEGTWINSAKDLKVEIRSSLLDIRVLEAANAAWNRYKLIGPNRYKDNDGNVLELQNNNQVSWQSNRRGRVTLFREGTEPPGNIPSRDRRDRDDDSPRERNRDWHDGDDHRHEYDSRSRFATLNGTWFNQKTRHSMYVQSVTNGLRVSTGRAKPMLYVPTRDSKVFRSRNGDSLIWLNDHTIQMKGNGQLNLIFHRANEHGQKTKGKGKGHYKEHPKSHAKKGW